MKKSFWRSTLQVFSKSEKYTDKFKNYKVPKSKEELPNRAEFSGDKQPSSGDPAKIELNHWHSGNSTFQKDKKVEKSNEKIPSPVTQEKNKREFMGNKGVERTSKKGSWRRVFSDVNFEQKPDGGVSIDVTGLPTPKAVSEEGPTGANDGYGAEDNGGETAEKTTSKWRRRFLTASDADMDFKREPDGTMVLKVKHLNNAVNTQQEIPGEIPHTQSPQAPGVETPSSPQEASFGAPQPPTIASVKCADHKNMKEHLLRKQGNLSLIARECDDKVGIFIEAAIKGSNDKEVLAQEIKARNGKQWRELLNESVWVNHFENYIKEM